MMENIGEIIARHKAHPTTLNAIRVVCTFRILAERVVRKCKFSIPNKKEAIEECAEIACAKAGQDHDYKDKAFNYFTTTMMGHLRQLYK